jgi:hypothetical protein
MDVPEHWGPYSCADYYSSQLAAHGYWDEPGQLWTIEPAERVEEDAEAEFLQVGRPGCDNIGFGYRRGQPGLWAYHRMERRFQYLAPSVQLLLDGWLSGKISV